jgi:aspartate kinase
MIVMKFGGSSLGSVESIRQVVRIVGRELHRRPIVVASAIGDTTDALLELLTHARRGNSYPAWKALEEIKTQHFPIAEELLDGERQNEVDQFLRDTFRDLHVRILELCEGERAFNAELQDWVLSLGEQLSSRLLTAVLDEHCGSARHVDARKLIVTNDNFTRAEPRYWETYARIRWCVPMAARESTVVLGGFIGSTQDGRTTTLGRGGSDLTASIVGAALNVEEIQVWKDVDGMLTCDPRLFGTVYQVRNLSYAEATELASAGATILHPETMAPAQRLRIPIVIRNTFDFGCEGTRIDSQIAGNRNVVKSIAATNGVRLLEIRSANASDALTELLQFCQERSEGMTVLSSTEECVLIAIDRHTRVPDLRPFESGCLEVRIRNSQSILTLVGQIANPIDISRRVAAVLHGIDAFIVPNERAKCSLSVSVAETEAKRCIALLHHTFFANPDPALFVVRNGAVARIHTPQQNMAEEKRSIGLKAFVASTNILQPN